MLPVQFWIEKCTNLKSVIITFQYQLGLVSTLHATKKQRRFTATRQRRCTHQTTIYQLWLLQERRQLATSSYIPAALFGIHLSFEIVCMSVLIIVIIHHQLSFDKTYSIMKCFIELNKFLSDSEGRNCLSNTC